MNGWVVFDLDGTLIESEQIWRDVRRDFVAEHFGRWRDDAQRTMMGMRSDDWALYMHEELSVAVPAAVIKEQVVTRVIDRLCAEIPILPGAESTLERLSGEFVLGLATSSAPAVATAVLRKTGWTRYFSAVVSADEVSHGKPAPDVYLRALEMLSGNAAQAAAVEDSANGIRSADAAGLAVIAVPNREFPPDVQTRALAARVLETLEALDAETIRSALEVR